MVHCFPENGRMPMTMIAAAMLRSNLSRDRLAKKMKMSHSHVGRLRSPGQKHDARDHTATDHGA